MRLPKHQAPTSPGEMLQHFIEEYAVTQVQLAQHLGWPVARINQIVKGKRAITPETALGLADAFGNAAQFWLNVQQAYDLWHALQSHRKRPGLKVG